MIRLSELAWKLIARVVALPVARDVLIRQALKTPYTHIGPEEDRYMERYWLFNPYNRNYVARFPRLPSIRIHHICRPDSDAHHHDHPLRSRSILLKGWYCERRYIRGVMSYFAGDTYRLTPRQEYHSVYAMPASGVWSVFITWPKRDNGIDGEWGFLVDGLWVNHLTYKAMIGGRAVK